MFQRGKLKEATCFKGVPKNWAFSYFCHKPMPQNAKMPCYGSVPGAELWLMETQQLSQTVVLTRPLAKRRETSSVPKKLESQTGFPLLPIYALRPGDMDVLLEQRAERELGSASRDSRFHCAILPQEVADGCNAIQARPDLQQDQ